MTIDVFDIFFGWSTGRYGRSPTGSTKILDCFWRSSKDLKADVKVCEGQCLRWNAKPHFYSQLGRVRPMPATIDVNK